MADIANTTTRTGFGIDWNNEIGGGVSGVSVDAVDQSQKRRNPTGKTRYVDDEIPDNKRRKITLTGRSLHRNFEIAAWAIRKHLDFVSRFSFSCNTADSAFNTAIEDFVHFWSRPANFDSKGRHGLGKSLRIAETMRCIDGDIFFMRLRDGRLQAIESDRIKTPSRRQKTDFDQARTFNGVECSKAGRPLRYAVHSRERGGGVKFERWVRARHIFAHGFYDRFDQTRGVSPIVSALNRYEDVYENFDYALQRSKLSQIFGLVVTRDAVEGEFGAVSGEDTDGDGTDDAFSVKLGTRPHIFDMDPGGDAKFIESRQPATEFQQFTSMMIAVALKSLDIPFSFYDEAYTNFYGSKAALTLYLQSSRDKRDDVKELLRKLTVWRLRLAIEDGDVSLPAGMTSINDIKFEWTPAGVPWFDPRDVRGDIDAIKAGLKTREQVRRERFGDSWSNDVVPVLVEEEKIIEEFGLNVTMETPPSQTDSEGNQINE